METKLRDVVLGAIADTDPEIDWNVGNHIVDVLMRRLKNASNIELDDGTLFVRRAPPTRCPEKIWHGPGHQSSTPCRVQGEHEVHEAVYGEFNQFAQWRTRPDGKPVFSGAFDEPPSGGDE